MLLGAIILKNVQNVNSFQRSTQVIVRQGNPTTIYFQLVDLEQKDENGQPLRYVPSSGATMTATINAMNQAHVISRVSTQPYSADDRSIWQLSIGASDRPATGNLDIQLAEGSTIRTTSIANAVIVWSTNTGMVV
jgi:hypothetical protein